MRISPNSLDAGPLIERARRYLRKIPPAISGQGGDKATFRTACVLSRKFNLSEEIVHALMAAEYNPRCQPPWPEAELRRKVRAALTALGVSTSPLDGQLGSVSNPTTLCCPSKWPERDDELRRQIIEEGIGIDGLRARTGVVFDDNSGKSIPEILAFLFFSKVVRDPLLCIAGKKSRWFTRPLSVWSADRGLSSYSLIVPSPMCAASGLTQEGRPSQRCLGNTGPRHYLVIEFDSGTLDEQASILWHLGKIGLLTMVVHSGGKSLHGWFLCRGEAEEDLSRFFRYAVRLGADPRLQTRCQLVRLPFGLRDNGVRQDVLYFNLNPILEREVLDGH